jgi:hypothetical protein
VVESPQQDESVVNSGGKVTVRLASTPALAPEHVVNLYLDGARVNGVSPNAMSHELNEVPRGTHTLKVVVSTTDGQMIQESPPTTFHVRQRIDRQAARRSSDAQSAEAAHQGWKQTAHDAAELSSIERRLSADRPAYQSSHEDSAGARRPEEVNILHAPRSRRVGAIASTLPLRNQAG